MLLAVILCEICLQFSIRSRTPSLNGSFNSLSRKVSFSFSFPTVLFIANFKCLCIFIFHLLTILCSRRGISRSRKCLYSQSMTNIWFIFIILGKNYFPLICFVVCSINISARVVLVLFCASINISIQRISLAFTHTHIWLKNQHKDIWNDLLTPMTNHLHHLTFIGPLVSVCLYFFIFEILLLFLNCFTSKVILLLSCCIWTRFKACSTLFQAWLKDWHDCTCWRNSEWDTKTAESTHE